MFDMTSIEPNVRSIPGHPRSCTVNRGFKPAEKASFEIKVAVTVQDEEGEAEEGDFMVEEHQYSPAAASSNDAVVLFPLKNGDEIPSRSALQAANAETGIQVMVDGEDFAVISVMSDARHCWRNNAKSSR
ncbi:Orexin receptor type 2 [Branchiostoma belcheri]|nr:Orexin receptor type 2 [Branchiostoma belcheri]